jgi:SPP1 family predicted phage head-tail adaptor
MLIGKMDRYITIKIPTEATSADTGGVSISGYTDYKSCWVQRVQDQSMERFEGDQLVLVDTYEYRIRYMDAEAITVKMEILDDGIYYSIIGKKLVTRKDVWIITATTKDNV